MASQLLNIRRAFEKKMQEITTTAIDTAYENAPFKESKKPYQRLILVPRQPENPTLGDGYYREVGEFLIFLAYPNNKGVAEVYQRASEIQDTFHRGFSMEENGTVLTVRTTPEISGAVIIDDRYIVTISVEYFASVLRA